MPRHHDETGDEELTPDEQRLRALLHEAVAEVDPADRLGELRRRTHTAGRAGQRRRWLPIVAAAGLTTAAVVAASVLIADIGLPQDPPLAQRPQTGVAAPTAPAAIYYLADTVDGTRLFREFAAVPGAPDDAVATALSRLAADVGPDDPDYRTAWPAGSFEGAEVSADRISIDLAAEALDRPRGISVTEAGLGIQQAVYTAEAAVGSSLPVEFRYDGVAATTVLGEAVTGPVGRDRRYAVTAPVNISDPAEGVAASETLLARGTAADSVSRIRWRLRNLDDGTVLRGRTDSIAPTGDADPTAVPTWETGPIDISSLPIGTYTFVVSGIQRSPDKTRIRFRDDRTIVVG